ncbi:8-oxo-dGTP diphosphatase [Lottiidibacillus patelloidae]|nr:8-oxo-dGTP diphosphatase [Lottiidibacillus patelloidae]
MVEHKLFTMTVIENDGHILLMKRPSEKGYPGYLAPGGKVDFPESILDCAIREVKEETGLLVSNLVYKGIDEYVNEQGNVRYMVFNYWTNSFSGKLLDNPPEGELEWVAKENATSLPMQDWFKQRLPYFFKEGTFEIHVKWNEEKKKIDETLIRAT